MVDLSLYLNQTVKVKYRSGETDTVVIEDSGDCGYPYDIEGRTYAKNGLYYKDATDDWDVVEITPVNNTSNNNTSNNNQMQPVTISDYIQLLTTVKEKYGDLDVVYVRDGDNVIEDANNFEDVIVTGGTTSLIRNRIIDNEKSKLVFITM